MEWNDRRANASAVSRIAKRVAPEGNFAISQTGDRVEVYHEGPNNPHAKKLSRHLKNQGYVVVRTAGGMHITRAPGLK